MTSDESFHSSLVNRWTLQASRFGEYSVVGGGECVFRDLVPTDPCDPTGLVRARLSCEYAAKEHVDLHGELGIRVFKNSGGGFGLDCEPGLFFHLACYAGCGSPGGTSRSNVRATMLIKL